MRLLLITQKVDRSDPVLGFFHRWIEKFSKYYESITVICLYKGEYNLPNNVRVLSLGKENGKSKIEYIINFYKYIYQEKDNYDKVFVHMNQEYILLAGIVWKIMKKDIFMWRNHNIGNKLTDLAGLFCKKVFCTSRFSYTAKYQNTQIMPVGVDLENFKPNSSIKRIPNSILSLGRIAPSKNIDILVDALVEINNPDIITSIYGNPLPQDEIYYKGLEIKGENHIDFYKGVTNIETIDIYSANQIFVNMSSSGMYDKTIFEAIACGCLILVSNDNLRGQISDDFIFHERNKSEFILKLNKLLNYSDDQISKAKIELSNFIKSHSLDNLGQKLYDSIK
jgi:glycosyltransferase involved in cell wall biosynthesis